MEITNNRRPSVPVTAISQLELAFDSFVVLVRQTRRPQTAATSSKASQPPTVAAAGIAKPFEIDASIAMRKPALAGEIMNRIEVDRSLRQELFDTYIHLPENRATLYTQRIVAIRQKIRSVELLFEALKSGSEAVIDDLTFSKELTAYDVNVWFKTIDSSNTPIDDKTQVALGIRTEHQYLISLLKYFSLSLISLDLFLQEVTEQSSRTKQTDHIKPTRVQVKKSYPPPLIMVIIQDAISRSLEPYVNKTQHGDLKRVLDQKEIQGRIWVKQQANTLVYVFKEKLGEINKTAVSHWLAQYFSWGYESEKPVIQSVAFDVLRGKAEVPRDKQIP